MRLSCAEIRRLFWHLVLVVERSAKAILHWSWWRRWHQAWARYYHYRHRENRREPRTLPVASETMAREAVGAVDENGANDIVEQVWQRLQPLLPTTKRCGRPYSHDRRLIVAAIVHQRQTGCAWNKLPSHFPPYQTVHTQLRNWQKTGLWGIAWNEGLEQPYPTE